MMNLSERIRTARALRGIYQKDVAAALGKARSTVCMWEKGTNTPSIEDLVELSAYLKVSSVWMTLGQGQPPTIEATK